MKRRNIIICIFALVGITFTLQLKAYFGLNKMYEKYSDELYSELQENPINFNQESIFKYEDLSKKYQEKILKREYMNINTVQEASAFFNGVKADIMGVRVTKRMTGPVYGTSVDRGSYSCSIAYDVILGVEWFKPVILKCNIYIYK